MPNPNDFYGTGRLVVDDQTSQENPVMGELDYVKLACQAITTAVNEASKAGASHASCPIAALNILLAEVEQQRIKPFADDVMQDSGYDRG